MIDKKEDTIIRSHKTGIVLPREGVFVRAIENLGRQLILVNFGKAGEEYLYCKRFRLDLWSHPRR